MVADDVFDELFVLEMANNHWGKLDRGLKIVRDFSRIVRFNNVKAAIKIQLRDVDTFIHKDFREPRTSATSPRRSTRKCPGRFHRARPGNPSGRLRLLGDAVR